MAQLTLELPDLYYRRLEKESNRAGKAIERLIFEWILQFPEPEYNFDGFDSDAPADLSINSDKYLYGE